MNKERGWMDHEHSPPSQETIEPYVPKTKEGSDAAALVDGIKIETERKKVVKSVAVFAEPDDSHGDPGRGAKKGSAT